MQLEDLLQKLQNSPATVAFTDVIAVIDAYYSFTETAFTNGNIHNEAGQNNGSCKIFAFAKLQCLSKEQTLACFGDYYRVDVLQHPEANDHQNIRNFMETAWAGIAFETQALSEIR